MKRITIILFGLVLISTLILNHLYASSYFIPAQQEDKTQTIDPAIAIHQTALAAQVKSDYPAAIQNWERLLTEAADSPLADEAGYHLGVCHVKTENYQNAIDVLKPTVTKLSDNPELQPQAYLFLGFAQLRLGEQLQQEQTAEAIRQSNISLTTATQTFATLRDKYPQFEDMDQACFFQGNAFEALSRLGREFEYRLDNAKESYLKMLSYPTQTYRLDGLYAIATVHERLGEYTDALNHYDQFRTDAETVGGHEQLDEVNFRSANIHIQLAIASTQRDAADAANKHYQNAGLLLHAIADKTESPRATVAALTLVKLHIQQQQDSQASRIIDLIIAGKPILEKHLTAKPAVDEENKNSPDAKETCMTGASLLNQQKYAAAITEFKRVYTGLGGTEAAADIRPWQAYALYEAARANVLQLENATPEQKSELTQKAIGLLEHLVQHYGDDRLAPEAKRQIERIKN